jgi:phenylacetic acid degradation operon negative regulatory protein
MTDDSLNTLPTPKRLVLSLLSAPDMSQISARQCAQWGQLFAIDPAAMRVALGRMVKAGLLRSARRGHYVIGSKGRVLSETARSWISAEDRVGPWDGRWLLVHIAHLGRRDKTELRARERALRLEGFVPMVPGLWIRPGNYREPLEATRSRMLTLGLDSDAVVLSSDKLLDGRASHSALWPREELEADYQRLTRAMQASMRSIDDLDEQAAARETFLLGEAVIRQINSDPLLPDAMIDAKARRKLHQTMVAYDALGRFAWARFQN